MTINAISAAIVADGRTRFQKHMKVEVATNLLINHLVYFILSNPSTAASANTSDGSSLCWIERIH